MRSASSRLYFLDLMEDGHRVQVIYNQSRVGLGQPEFAERMAQIRKGDIICKTHSYPMPSRKSSTNVIIAVAGSPGKSSTDELSIFTSKMPEILSPSLNMPPPSLIHLDKRAAFRHVDLQVNKHTQNILRGRSKIINHMRTYFLDDNFTEVQTPLMADVAGGAVARPFETTSTVFGEDRKLQLRIAPELWLKRLVIGGMERIFEIGVNFRNEGADRMHNPEFTSCEYYEAYGNLETAIKRTEDLLYDIALLVNKKDFYPMDLKRDEMAGFQPTQPAQAEVFKGPYERIDFLPALESIIGEKFPDLEDPSSIDILSSMLSKHKIPSPAIVNAPNLLNALCAHLLEPLCIKPTFIINPPGCLSPLSKTSIRPSDGQRIAHRVELFYNKQELVNAYEEENNPFEQRRKFEEQMKYRTDLGETMELDESYLAAMEWGLPPTAGWGIGVDRLCMMMMGLDSISDCMAFGGLRGTMLSVRQPKGLTIL